MLDLYSIVTEDINIQVKDRYHCKTPLEVRNEALFLENPTRYPIPVNKRIDKYKKKWCA